VSRSPWRHLSIAIATALMATVALSANAFADPSTGTVAGHLTDGGNAMPDVPVGLYDLNFSPVATTVTDAGGAFSFSDVDPGSYKISFNLPGFIDQWVHHKPGFDQADPVSVVAGETTVVEETVVPHGSLRGRVTNADGTAFTQPYVTARSDDGFVFAQTNGDFDGNYSLPVLPVGSYRISFSHGFSGPTQFARGKTDFAAADLIEITEGAETMLDETFLPTGAVAGHLSRSGTPISGATVQLLGPEGTFGFTTTGPEGQYRIETFPGTFKVQFQFNGLTQWAHGKSSEADADSFVVAAGPDTIVDEEALPVGTVAGRLTGADGNPVSGANVAVEDGNLFLSGFTDGDGRYSIEAPAGQYRVVFGLDFNGRQWAFGQSTAGAADTITVVDNQTTVVDDTLRPFGSVTVTARDATTHAPILAFCSNLGGIFAGGCTQDGTVTFPEVLAGRYFADAFPDAPGYLYTYVTGVIVTSGQNTSVVVDVPREATITTTVRDAATGAPVAGICVEAVRPLAPTTLTGGGSCSDETGAVTVNQLGAGTYTLFAWAQDGVHGHQWVGPTGGTGAQAKARLVTVRAGQSVTIPPVKMDRAGTVSGVITDAATGVGLKFATASISSYDDGLGAGGGLVSTDDTGHYTFAGLGPYAWTLFFRKYSHAAEFSGGTPNRLLATGIKVRAGETTTYNVSLSTGTRLSVRVLGPQGQPIEFARITVVQALSGDSLASGDCVGAQNCVAPALGPHLVKLAYNGSVHGEQYAGYVGGSDFLHASVFTVPAAGTKQITVKMTQLSP